MRTHSRMRADRGRGVSIQVYPEKKNRGSFVHGFSQVLWGGGRGLLLFVGIGPHLHIAEPEDMDL